MYWILTAYTLFLVNNGSLIIINVPYSYKMLVTYSVNVEKHFFVNLEMHKNKIINEYYMEIKKVNQTIFQTF